MRAESWHSSSWIFNGMRTGNGEWDVCSRSSTLPAHDTCSSLSFLPSNFLYLLAFSSNSHKPFLLLSPIFLTALVLLLRLFPFQMSQVALKLLFHLGISWDAVTPLLCVAVSRGCCVRTAVLTKCQRRSSASTRTQPAVKAAAGHLFITSTLSQIIGSDV